MQPTNNIHKHEQNVKMCKKIYNMSVNVFINKYASYPDWRISPHAGLFYSTIPSQRWLTRDSVVTSQFVTDSSSSALHFLASGLTPGPKFTKIRHDLLPTQVYHPAKI